MSGRRGLGKDRKSEVAVFNLGASMKLLIDAVGAPARSGGVSLWATELVRRWGTIFPEDEITVVSGPELASASRAAGHQSISLPSDSPSSRGLAQLILIPSIFFNGKFTHLLVLNSVLSPLLWSAKTTIINHDWRHIGRPEEFSRWQRFRRRFWEPSTRQAQNVIVNSKKTANETFAITGRRRVHVVNPGGDHLVGEALMEKPPIKLPPGGFFVVYAHHTNKRPNLAIEALSAAVGMERQLGGLVILGATSVSKDALRAQAKLLNVKDKICFADYLPEAQYAWLIRKSAGILILSTDEGYSIPVEEAKVAGVPAIVAKGTGIAGLVHREVMSVGEDPSEIGKAMRQILRRRRKSPIHFSSARSWQNVVLETRKVMSNDIGLPLKLDQSSCSSSSI